MNVELPNRSDAMEALEHLVNWVVIFSLFTVTWVIQILIASESLSENQAQALAELVEIGPNVVLSPWTILLGMVVLWMLTPAMTLIIQTVVAKLTGGKA